MLFTAYDPSRDLSPNLPTTSCESTANLSSGPSRSSSSSGCSTPINTTRVGLCCTFKEEYESNDYTTKMPPSGCQDCGRHAATPFKTEPFSHHRPVCKTENGSPVDYNCSSRSADLYDFKKADYNQSIETKIENPIGSPEEDSLKMCAGCSRPISDRFYLRAVERHWHASCLQCSQCCRALDDEMTCFARDGNIYCQKDYQR